MNPHIVDRFNFFLRYHDGQPRICTELSWYGSWTRYTPELEKDILRGRAIEYYAGELLSGINLDALVEKYKTDVLINPLKRKGESDAQSK